MPNNTDDTLFMIVSAHIRTFDAPVFVFPVACTMYSPPLNAHQFHLLFAKATTNSQQFLSARASFNNAA